MYVKGIATMFVAGWTPWSWRHVGVPYQIPVYPEPTAYEKTLDVLSLKTPLVFAGECRLLENHIAEATCGKGFVLMGGDCAETFRDFAVDNVRDDFLLLLRMALIISYGSGVPATPIGRIAGQFAKPRSVLWDESGVRAYQGDIINDISIDKRTPDPQRMIDAYHQSAQTLNLIRAFRQGGIDNLPFLHELNTKGFDVLSETMTDEVRHKYKNHLEVMDKTIRFIQSTTRSTPSIGRFFTGHECLLLPYESALTRRDSTREDEWYDTSAHFLWLGERTRKKNASHVEFMRGIQNPIGIKVSGSTDLNELQEIVNVLNPKKKIGRITIITRMGADVLHLKLPSLLKALDDHPVMWCCDPMHANTDTLNSVKTRSLEKIFKEIHSFIAIMKRFKKHPGGVHLEMTSKHVTECIGGEIEKIDSDDLTSERYNSVCDPRLNGGQALEAAFFIADLLGDRT